ncbi:MAG: hypothetical protein IM628_02515 [Phenylobacterium sp.]|uniref:hypothetical protein n=1 Tax=Phenylobacterium sp. TaxID=1871053 RepID=UPI0025E167D6|nr:hypothetical protein [Phenylobacterium sp.]MCA6303680.1 hypothetical protein [Phenylobacterium sp.]
MRAVTRQGALTTTTYPHDPVRVACDRCGRQGRYRRSTLVGRFGADASMPDVLIRIAACPRHGSASDPCGAHFPDLATKP